MLQTLRNFMQLSAVEVRHDARLQSLPVVQHQRAHGGRRSGVLGTLPGAPHGLHALPKSGERDDRVALF
jgi:hypothetical protein